MKLKLIIEKMTENHWSRGLPYVHCKLRGVSEAPFFSSSVLVYVTGIHVVLFENNCAKKQIRKTDKAGQDRKPTPF